MSNSTREPRIRAAVACPLCGAGRGEPCRAGTMPHDARRGATDLREPLQRSHNERRAAWQERNRERELQGENR